MIRILFLSSIFCLSILSANVINVNDATGTYQVDKYGSKLNNNPQNRRINNDWLGEERGNKMNISSSRPVQKDMNIKKINKWK
jgi:hypothetical protein